MKKFFVFAFSITILMFMGNSSAVAAPFCSVNAWGKKCWYYSMESCLQSSNACVVNYNEVQVPSNGTPFCVVHSFGTQCWYHDASSCQRAAIQSGGACVYKGN